MAKIIVNEKLSVKGKLNVERSLVEEEYVDKNGDVKTRKSLRIEGVLATHLYFEEILTLETNRYKISNIEVYKESFASDDYNVLYHFVAEDIEVLGSNVDGAYYILYGEEMKMIEDLMYKDEHPILGDIGPEYKDMFVEEDDESEEEKEE